MDVLSFCSELIKCKSVTPADDGALYRIEKYLVSLGFETKVMSFESIDGKNVVKNLFAQWSSCKSEDKISKNKVLGFLGHSDVVPAGDDWEDDPFCAIQKDGYLIGRGVADMKGGIAAFCCAVEKFLRQAAETFDGSIRPFSKPNNSDEFLGAHGAHDRSVLEVREDSSTGATQKLPEGRRFQKRSIVILITGDDEVGSYEGARSLIKWCKENGHIPNDCLIGEPSSRENIGDHVYIGHRGSMNVQVKSVGKQGHIAYPNNYVNSLGNVCRYIASVMDYKWKHEDKRFPKTNLEPTMLFTNNYAENVAPDTTLAHLNIRFGLDYSADELKQILLKEAKIHNVSLEFSLSGNSYCCDDEKLKTLLTSSIKEITGIEPEFSAGGGISDGRHMIEHCNIIEFGLQDVNIHQKNEKIKIDDLIMLEKIYLSFLKKYFQ
jgi:succinyl-diaminopimelate desuccinylase